MQPVRRVGLIGAQHLLREGIEVLLGQVEDVQICGPWEATPAALKAIEDSQPDVILMVEATPGDQSITELTSSVLDRFPQLPVIRITIEKSTFQVYRSYPSPARSETLAAILRDLAPVGWTETPSPTQSKPGGETHAHA